MLARTRMLAVVGAIASVVSVAGTSPAATTDLNTRGGIDAHLRALGIDPATAVIQDALLNYAGPDCPGAGWSCVAATGPVVQISSGGINIFEASGGSSHDPNACTVTQSNTTGPNDAVCALNTTTNGVTQRVRITQDNGSGANSADVDAVASVSETVLAGLSAMFDQNIRQEATVLQKSTSGANTASVLQQTDLRSEARAVSTATSRQDSSALLVIEQDSTSGNQSATLTQDHGLVSQFLDVAGNSRQEQQTRATDRNVIAFASQESGSGINDLDLRQDQSLNAMADNVLGTVTELQASNDGGMIGDIQQESATGTSHYDADIDKAMIADQDATTVVQLEDPDCCDLLGLAPRTPTTCTIDMDVVVSGPAHAHQEAFLHGRSFADTNCEVDLQLVLQAGATPTTLHQHRSGTFVDVFIDCDAGACTTGDTPMETDGSAGNLHLAVRNQTDGEQFSAVDAQMPNFTDAENGEILEFKLEFHNHVQAPFKSFTMSIPVPPGTSFVDCKGCANGGLPNPVTGRIEFNRGTGESGGTRSGTFRAQVTGASGLYSTQAASTSERGDIVSNVVRYWVG